MNKKDLILYQINELSIYDLIEEQQIKYEN